MDPLTLLSNEVRIEEELRGPETGATNLLHSHH